MDGLIDSSEGFGKLEIQELSEDSEFLMHLPRHTTESQLDLARLNLKMVLSVGFRPARRRPHYFACFSLVYIRSGQPPEASQIAVGLGVGPAYRETPEEAADDVDSETRRTQEEDGATFIHPL
jgi:hypothetical protein